VLLVAWSAIAAMETADDLEAAGYEVAGPFVQCAAAVRALDEARPDFAVPDLAVLDLTLADGPCNALARELRRQGVPFLIHTSWSRRDEIAPEFHHAPWLEKPCPSGSLVQAVDRLVREPADA
jgi:DNA-binding response OmpR family regulator